MDTLSPFTALVGTVGFGGLCVIGGWVWHLSSKLANLDASVTQARSTADKADKRGEETSKNLQRFELDAHRTFVSLSYITDFEGRLDTKLDHIADRLDRLVDRHTTAEGSR